MTIPALPGMDPSIKTEFIEANGLRFEVLTCAAQKKDGRTPDDRLALCLHGFPEHAYSWRHQMPALAALGYKVWAPNLRGYGQTDKPEGWPAYSVENLCADVAALIDAASAKEVVLIAHDWGAAIAWAFAIKNVRPLDRLIIMNLPHPALFQKYVRRFPQVLRSWYMYFFQIPWLPETLLRMNNGAGIAWTINTIAVNRSKFPPEVMQVYRDNVKDPRTITAMLNYYRALFHRKTGLNDYDNKDKISTPTLMLWGEKDKALGIETTKETDNYVEDLTFRLLPGISHWVQQEAPETVNAMMTAWLSGKKVPQANETPNP